MNNYALLGEISKSLTPELEVMLSGRMDKYEFSKMSFSPRLSFIYNVAPLGLYKLSFQRSVRENTLAQLAARDYFSNQEPDQEVFDGVELSYQNTFNNQTSYDLALFYSDADLLGWNAQGGTEPGSIRTTSKTGHLTVGGIEFNIEYKTEDARYSFGLNHSYAKQLDFSLASGQSGSYISRSDSHDADYEGVLRNSIGEDRMNWANNRTKFYMNIKLTDKLTLFNSMRVAWGYEGNKNWMEMYENGAKGTAVENRVNADIAYMKKNDIFGTDFRFDFSADYKFSEVFSIMLYGQNLIKFTNNWRYVYIQEGGAATEEPTVVGVKSTYKFL